MSEERTAEERVTDHQRLLTQEQIERLGLGIAGVTPKIVAVSEGCVAATFSMEALKDALLGDETLAELVEAKRCSKNVGCGKSLVKDDGSPEYVFDSRDEAEVYEMEFRRTGLCPPCLDKALGEDEEDPREQELSQYSGMSVKDLPEHF